MLVFWFPFNLLLSHLKLILIRKVSYLKCKYRIIFFFSTNSSLAKFALKWTIAPRNRQTLSGLGTSLIWRQRLRKWSVVLQLVNLVKPSLDDGWNIEADQEGDDPVGDHHVGVELHEDSLGPQLADIDVESLSLSLIDVGL